MLANISDLLGQYEKGKLTRRELVAGLAALVTTGPSAALQGPTVDHISLFVSDLDRSAEFYTKVLGLTELGRGGPENTIRLGDKKKPFLVLRNGTPPGKVDHFALGLESFDKAAVTDALKQHGVTPIDLTTGAGFHVIDPDGYQVQLV